MTQPTVAEIKPASLWTRILAVLYVFDDALSTNELEYVERRFRKTRARIVHPQGRPLIALNGDRLCSIARSS
jgi:hypothetical protein